jgi:uncharacterized membrane protein YfcA
MAGLFILAFAATLAGAVTGMGGGVVIKPLLDAMGSFKPAEVNLLSSSAVLVMAFVSMARTLLKKKPSKQPLDFRLGLPIAVSAAIGGLIGQLAISSLISGFEKASVVVQNSILALLILTAFLCMRSKTARAPHCESFCVLAAAGAALGLLSSFLGIGGGPFNVALMVLALGFEAKEAVSCSMMVILFSQASKLASAFLLGGFSGARLGALPFLAAGGAFGGLAGSMLGEKLKARDVLRCFNALQAAIFSICALNIARAL